MIKYEKDRKLIKDILLGNLKGGYFLESRNPQEVYQCAIFDVYLGLFGYDGFDKFRERYGGQDGKNNRRN